MRQDPDEVHYGVAALIVFAVLLVLIGSVVVLLFTV